MAPSPDINDESPSEFANDVDDGLAPWALAAAAPPAMATAAKAAAVTLRAGVDRILMGVRSFWPDGHGSPAPDAPGYRSIRRPFRAGSEK